LSIFKELDVLRSEVSMFKRTSLLFLRARGEQRQKGGGVSDAIYRGGVKSGIPAG
jgi:hypothetical protein